MLRREPTNLVVVHQHREAVRPLPDLLVHVLEHEYGRDSFFENLFDGMFQDMSWDISSDISVMKTMMAQDGLVRDDQERRQ